MDEKSVYTSQYVENESHETSPVMGMAVDEIELSVRAYNCLRRAGINSLEELTQMTEDDLLKVRNLGIKSMKEVVEAMRKKGLSIKSSDETDVVIEEKSREKCNQLRQIRQKIAEANGIAYSPAECQNPHSACTGTCPACEAEAEYLEKQLDEKQKRGEKISVRNILS